MVVTIEYANVGMTALMMQMMMNRKNRATPGPKCKIEFSENHTFKDLFL